MLMGNHQLQDLELTVFHSKKVFTYLEAILEKEVNILMIFSNTKLLRKNGIIYKVLL